MRTGTIPAKGKSALERQPGAIGAVPRTPRQVVRSIAIEVAERRRQIIGAFPQGMSFGTGLPEMNEISLPLLDKWRCSISLSGSGKEDFFKHDRISISMETRSCRQLAVGRLY
jgi:hypothetical protein